MRRPLIGIPAQTLQSIDGIPGGLPHSWVMNSRYYLAAAAMDAVPVMIPLFDEDLATLRAIYDRLDGLLSAGRHPREERRKGGWFEQQGNTGEGRRNPVRPHVGRLGEHRGRGRLELSTAPSRLRR